MGGRARGFVTLGAVAAAFAYYTLWTIALPFFPELSARTPPSGPPMPTG